VATKQAWDALPEHVKADIAKREADIEAGTKRYVGLARFAEEAERNGTTLQNAAQGGNGQGQPPPQPQIDPNAISPTPASPQAFRTCRLISEPPTGRGGSGFVSINPNDAG
jgi:hypothetical protein